MVSKDERYAVFIDIDRTLTADSFAVPKQNLAAIAKARSMGHLVFINTGRSRGNIPKVLLDQIEVDGIVAGSGAHIEIGGELIYKVALPNETVREVAEYFLAQDEMWCIFEGEKGSYLIPNSTHTRSEELPIVTSADDFETKFSFDCIEVIAAGKTVPQDFIDRFSDRLTCFSFPTYADLICKGNNKALGMQKVLDITGIPREHTIAIGDSTNDTAMLQYAGIGVAMANAQPEVKRIADYITSSNYDSGVAFALEHFLFQKGVE